MNHYPTEVKQKLESILSDMADHHWLFTVNPGHDFMRQSCGKLSFYDTMMMIISMGKGSTNDEIVEYFDMDVDKIPSQSAFNQRRSQISLSAFEYLFSAFSESFPTYTNSFKDYCILAFDGTHVVYSTNAEIIEDYNKPHLIDHKGHNHMHLNAWVDIGSKAFLDVRIQPGQAPDERRAMHEMLEHFEPDHPDKYIITMDRGYESYDLIFDCELKHLNYVARVKSPLSKGSILSSFMSELPDEEEFDVQIKRIFTDQHNSIMKEQSDVYRYMNPNKNIPHFYPLLNGGHACYISFRVLKIKTGSDTYEYLMTNLPYTFSLEDLKECYHLRWGIEVSFRYLKYAAGLLHFHSKKPEFLKQEIFATLIMYNFGVFIANEAIKRNKERKRAQNNQHQYEIDFSTAIKLCREYLLRSIHGKTIDVIKLILKFVHAVKNGKRSFPRHLRGLGAIRLNYR